MFSGASGTRSTSPAAHVPTWPGRLEAGGRPRRVGAQSAGLRELVGGAEVSPMHANYFVNTAAHRGRRGR
jgi:hypothetical protein